MNTATLPRPILQSVRRSVVEERLRFVARLLDGEAMTELCREFGISRKTVLVLTRREKVLRAAVRLEVASECFRH